MFFLNKLFIFLSFLTIILSSEVKANESTPYNLNLRKGKKLYEKFCLGCHGVRGYGVRIEDSPFPRDLVQDKFLSHGKNDKEKIKTAITLGYPPASRRQVMSSFKRYLEIDDPTGVDLVVAYVLHLRTSQKKLLKRL